MSLVDAENRKGAEVAPGQLLLFTGSKLIKSTSCIACPGGALPFTFTVNVYFFFSSNCSGLSVEILRRLILETSFSSMLSVTTMLSGMHGLHIACGGHGGHL